LIDRRWLPLNALRAFEAVGRHLSFTAAANALSVSQSAISRHVIALEGLLGVQLFDRKPGQFALTEAGAALLPVVRKSFDRMEVALNDIVNDRGANARVLRVQMPTSFAHLLAVPILRSFRADHPQIVLDIESPHAVGHAARDADAAVIYAKPEVSDHVSNLLWMERLTPLCHPDLAPAPEVDLATFLLRSELLHVKLEGEPRHKMWQMLVGEAGLKLDVERGLVFDTSALAAQYALSGGGVALLDRRMFEADIAAGRLVAPFEILLEGGYGYYITVHSEDLADPAIAGFRAWMIRRFGMAETGASPRLAVVPPGLVDIAKARPR
jgi:DNA-binding transcriptional LysR family regulator